MGMENHRRRNGRLKNVLPIFAATRYNPTYKNKPDDVRIIGFLLFGAKAFFIPKCKKPLQSRLCKGFL